MTSKMPFFPTIFGSYFLLTENLKNFLALACLFSLLLTVFAYISGQESMCLNAVYQSNHFCSTNLFLFLLLKVLALMLIFIFMRCWYRWFLLKQQRPLQKKELLPSLTDFKFLGLMLAYIAMLAVSILSAYLLYIRVPNPNWKIELGFFTVVSIGFLFPIVGLRFLAYFAYVAEGTPLPAPLFIWRKTTGNMLQIIIFFVTLLILMLLLLQSVTYLTMSTKGIMFWDALLNEFLSNFAFFLVITCFLNYCYLQKKFFDERDSHE